MPLNVNVNVIICHNYFTTIATAAVPPSSPYQGWILQIPSALNTPPAPHQQETKLKPHTFTS